MAVSWPANRFPNTTVFLSSLEYYYDYTRAIIVLLLFAVDISV